MNDSIKDLFQNLKIVELSTVLAGPSVGMFFAELGAQVQKIENPKTKGDVTRSWRLPEEKKDTNISAYFASVNFGKKHIFLDLKNVEDQKKLQVLIKNADILITNHKKGRDIKYGIVYSELTKTNPGLIQCHLKGFDSNDDRSAYDVVLQAETGYMYMNGTKETGALKMPIAMMDILAAHQMKEAILIALLKRLKTGQGSYVECSLEKAGIANLSNQASNYLMAKHIPEAIGSLHPNIAPYGETFPCKDGKNIVLAVGNDEHFRNLCFVLERIGIAEDDRFLNNQSRVLNRMELFDILAILFLMKNRKEWMDLCLQNNVPAGAIKNMKEVFENSTAKKMILKESMEDMETKRVSTIAFDFVEKY